MYPHLNSRRTSLAGAALSVVLALATFGVIGTASGAGAATTSPIFYLDLGASVSVGVQPTPADPRGQPTNRGYANRLVALEAARGVALDLTKLGCPGESTTKMTTGNDGCYHAHDNQLADAITFLRTHHDQTGLVTIDLGFNDIAPCLRGATVDFTCVNQNLALLSSQLPAILTSLKAAAGANVTFIGLNHYNPYTAFALSGVNGAQFSRDSVKVMQELNFVLQTVYANYAIPTANVVRSFSHDATQGSRLGFRTLPINVQESCNLTWMCRTGRYGWNLHPNNAGYEAITDAIAALLPKW